MTRRRHPPAPPRPAALRRPWGGPAGLDQPGTGLSYPQLLRPSVLVGHGWLRPVVGCVLGLGVFLTAAAVVNQAVVAAGWVLAGRPASWADFAAAAARFEHPVGMLAANLAIAVVLLPTTAALMLLGHRRRPGWLVSVAGRPRWRWLAVSFAVALPVFGGLLVGSAVLSPGPAPGPQPALAGFLAVIVLTSPLQATAEEVFFRGYLTQALGSLAGGPAFGIVASSLMFAALHGAQNPPLFLNRLAFGLLAGLLVWLTGGLEAPIAAHVVNNVLAYTAAAATGTIAELRAVDELSWAASATGTFGYAVFGVLAVAAARRRLGTPTTTMGQAHDAS